MTREEVIDQLQNCKELILQNGKDWLDERDIPLLDIAIEALSEPKMGWIPVSEKLPETGDSILVTYSDEEIGIVWSARPKVWGKYEKANNLIFPIAWIPLPKPYKGGEEE